jgi:hypothetical protein
MAIIFHFEKKTLPLFRTVPALASGENREGKFVPLSITFCRACPLLDHRVHTRSSLSISSGTSD